MYSQCQEKRDSTCLRSPLTTSHRKKEHGDVLKLHFDLSERRQASSTHRQRSQTMYRGSIGYEDRALRPSEEVVLTSVVKMMFTVSIQIFAEVDLGTRVAGEVATAVSTIANWCVMDTVVLDCVTGIGNKKVMKLSVMNRGIICQSKTAS